MNVAITCDEISPAYSLGIMRKYAELLNHYFVPSTLFLIPNFAGRYPFSSFPEWVSEVRALNAAGHEIGLHGYDHGVLEFGWRHLDFHPPKSIQRWKIARGRSMLEKLFGCTVNGFRGPWFSGNGTTERILKELKFEYVSSDVELFEPHTYLAYAPPLMELYKKSCNFKIVRKALFSLQFNTLTKDMSCEYGLPHIKMVGEYTWKSPKGSGDFLFDVLLKDMEHRESKGFETFVLLTHISGLNNEGFRTLEKFIIHCRNNGYEFVTLADEISSRSDDI